MSRLNRLSVAAAAAIGVASIAGTAFAATPIPPGGATTLPAYVGKPAVPHPVHVPPTPQNPFMAPNGESSTHNDSWQSDAYSYAGPLGNNPVMTSNGSFSEDCISPSFDRAGRVISICSTPAKPGPTLRMFDPVTLDVIASVDLPARPAPLSGVPTLKDTSGGVYFYIDNQNRVVNVAPNNHVLRFKIEANRFVQDADFDVASHLNQQYPATDAPRQRLVSALPDWKGLIWFVTRYDGVVGTLDPRTGAVHTLQLGDGLENSIENSFAIGRDGVYVATNRQMVSLEADRQGQPVVEWASTYQNSGLSKPGQFDDGTGTTPTILPGGFVAITDNSDPMNVVVYRTEKSRHQTVCEVPVFDKGASASENSLIGAGNSLIVENNYGYDVFGFQTGAVQSKPGMTRIDIDRDKKGCHVAWTNSNEVVPSVISKLSLATGLIHTYTRKVDAAGVQGWYWTSIDFHTGKTVNSVLAGTGPQWNNHYAAIAIGPDGTEYTSGFPGGLWSIRDGSTSHQH